MLLSFNVTTTLFDIIVKAIIVLKLLQKHHYDDGDNEMILIH